MNIEKLKANGIDYDDGLIRFSGNRKMYEKYLYRFAEDTTYQELRDALCRRDTEAAFHAAHRLKAFVGNLSINQFYEEIKALTEDLRNGTQRDYFPDIVKLDQQYERILQSIRGKDHE